MNIKKPECPFCGGGLTYVLKHLSSDPLTPNYVVGFRCYNKKCRQFYTFVNCWWEEDVETAKELLLEQVKSIQQEK